MQEHEVLSRIETVLLAMINQEPRYAYEIEKCIEEAVMRRWVRIGSASIYQGLERLAAKGMATYESEQEGKMPPRRRYSITPSGRRALDDAVCGLLRSGEDHFLDLNLGLFCSNVIPPADLPGLLEQRLGEVRKRRRQLLELTRSAEPRRVWRQTAILGTLLNLCRAEEKTLSELLKTLPSTKQG